MIRKRKPTCGVGNNDSDYVVETKRLVNGRKLLEWICPYFVTWRSMLQRCYDFKHQRKHPSYIGCSVCEEWLTFSNFKAWMEQQDWEGKELDKDLLVCGNRIYSPETCIFIPVKVNCFMLEANSLRGEYPIGVSWHSRDKKFQARCSNPFTNKVEQLGYFDCPQKAHQAWLKRKLELAKLLAEQQDDPRVAEALIKRYENYGQ